MSQVQALPKADTVHTAIDTVFFFGFVDSSDATPSSTEWSFGDGGAAAGSSVAHVYAASGRYTVVFTATNADGVPSYDSAVITSNFPPCSLRLIDPTRLRETPINQLVTFQWTVFEPDNTDVLKFDLFIGDSASLGEPHKVASGLAASSFGGWNSGTKTGVRYWKIAAHDGIDTTLSGVDSFQVVDFIFRTGRCAGVAVLAGVHSFDGISVTWVPDSGVTRYATVTDSTGSFSVSNLLPGDYTVTAASLNRPGFLPQSRRMTIAGGDSIRLDTFALPDTALPLVAVLVPAQGDTFKTSREVVLTGTWSDLGSGILPDSATVLLNGVRIASVGSDSGGWYTRPIALTDGRFEASLLAQDRAGNRVQSQPRLFFINAKKLKLTVSSDTVSIGDSLVVTAIATGALPAVRVFRLSADTGTGAPFLDSLVPSGDTARFTIPSRNAVATGLVRVTAVDDSDMAVSDVATYTVLQDSPSVELLSGDTVVDFGGAFRCRLTASQRFGALFMEYGLDSSGDVWRPLHHHGGLLDTVLPSDSLWRTLLIRVRVTDDDSNRILRSFRVGIRPRRVGLTRLDSTENSITAVYERSPDSDCRLYRIYRDRTATVDSGSPLWATVSDPEQTMQAVSCPAQDWVTYYYRVYVTDSGGLTGPGGNVLSARIKSTAPSGLSVAGIAESDTLLSGYDPLSDLWKPRFVWQVIDSNRPLDTLRYRLYLDTVNPPVRLAYTGADSFFQSMAADLRGQRTWHLKIVAQDLSGGTDSFSLRFHLPADPYNRMILLTGGQFSMGSSQELPVHSVTLSPFKMSNSFVTQREFIRVMVTNPSERAVSGLFPVERVNWFDAVRYCIKRTSLEGLQQCYDTTGWTPSMSPYTGPVLDTSKDGYRMPTEAEWEYACRGGTAGDYYWGAAAPDSFAWYYGNSSMVTHPAGLKVPNAFGLFDMNGNVWEWCWDWYDTYAAGAQMDPSGPATGTYRVLRGGSWSSDPASLRSAYRNLDYPYTRYNDTGFRVVRR